MQSGNCYQGHCDHCYGSSDIAGRFTGQEQAKVMVSQKPAVLFSWHYYRPEALRHGLLPQ
jgi:hypothetical protein